jgi:hypothetical protein
MSSYYNYGDEITQHGVYNIGKIQGDHNVGMIQNQGPADPKEIFREMIDAVQVLRGQVSAADRQIIDESMKAVGTGGNVEKGTLRRALGSIAGVATMVGEVGVPVIQSIHAVMAAFGL